jgi:chorismate synthase
MEPCLDLQRLIWGQDFTELVPATILWIAAGTGGVVAGAFEGDRIVGFLFGITGFREGRPTHWSDMLAVHPDARGRGVGQALKRFQRETLLRRGVDHVAWTFDPLESRNAWLNFARLGITVREYIPDCYGASSSPLHAGLSTDRLVADWRLSSARVRHRMEGGERGPVHVPEAPAVNDRDEVRTDLTAPQVRIVIPSDIQAVKAADPAAARQWRATTRAAFLAYLGRGYEATEVLRESADRSSYLLERRADP